MVVSWCYGNLKIYFRHLYRKGNFFCDFWRNIVLCIEYFYVLSCILEIYFVSLWELHKRIFFPQIKFEENNLFMERYLSQVFTFGFISLVVPSNTPNNSYLLVSISDALYAEATYSILQTTQEREKIIVWGLSSSRAYKASLLPTNKLSFRVGWY